MPEANRCMQIKVLNIFLQSRYMAKIVAEKIMVSHSFVLCKCILGGWISEGEGKDAFNWSV